MRIGLIGIYGLYNYGCEAIIRGTYELTKKAWPDSQIIFYTFNLEEDTLILKDTDINIKQVPIKKYLLLLRIVNKLLRLLSIDKQYNHWDSGKVISELDLVISVGGDIYTIPKYVLKNNLEEKFNPIVEFGKKVIKKIPMFIWGASIGPFGEKQKIKNYYFNHLKDINQIFCREYTSYNYLKSNGLINNIQLCSDPAFYVKSDKIPRKLEKNKTKIALNLSPLSIKEQVGDTYESFNKDIIEVLQDLSTIENVEITLVPHVKSPLSIDDNDLHYLKQIYESIPVTFKEKVSLLENENGFLETKSFLKTCNIVIAARMHCAVNAVTEGIPTIFLTYSQKSLGMTNHIYGSTYWSIPLLNIKTELKDKVVEMLSKQDAISIEISNRIIEIKNEEETIIELFKEQFR